MRLMAKRRQSRANRVEVSRPIDGVVVWRPATVSAPPAPMMPNPATSARAAAPHGPAANIAQADDVTGAGRIEAPKPRC
jgi:hypothetical protein